MTAGSLVISNTPVSRFEEGLDLFEAKGWRETGTQRFEWLVHAELPLVCVRIGRAPEQLRLGWRPPELWDQKAVDEIVYSHKFARKTGEPQTASPFAGRTRAERGITDRTAVMSFSLDGRELLLLQLRIYAGGELLPIKMQDKEFVVDSRGRKELLLVVSVCSTQRQSAITVGSILSNIAGGVPVWKNLLASHRRWWEAYWGESGLSLSAPALDRIWHLGMYHLGCCCRPDSPPMPLQGVWGDDGLPPWMGNYTWDLNVQACYWPIYASNHLAMGYSLYNWYRDKLPLWREYGQRFYGIDGAALPGATDDCGRAHHRTFYPSNGAWVCHSLWQHFLYSGDKDFLQSYILPVFREHLKFHRAVSRLGSDGQYHLDKGASPELGWDITDTAYEISLAKFLAGAYRDTIRLLGIGADELDTWAAEFLEKVVEYPKGAVTGSNYYWPEDPEIPEYFVEWPGYETELTHRHFSQFMMISPLGEIHRFSDYRLLRCAQNTLHRMMTRGNGGWVGFSFPWAAMLATRLAWPPAMRMPAYMLELYERNVTSPSNGLPLNEDHQRLGMLNQTGAFGPHHLTNFTLEAGMMAVTAVQEMLLHPAGDALVIAGGVPPELDGEFWGLRGPTGERVAGKIESGRLVSAELVCERGGVRRLAAGNGTGGWKSSLSDAAIAQQRDTVVIRGTMPAGSQHWIRRR